MWKRGEAVFKHGKEGSYLGVATDIASSVAELQAQDARHADKRALQDAVVVGPLELKSSKGKRSKTAVERAEEAAEADNVYERLLEKAKRYVEGEEGPGLVDHERKRFEVGGGGEGKAPIEATTALQGILSRIPPLALPVVGRADMEEEREKRRQAKLATVLRGSGKPPSDVIQNLLRE
jgi:hypothetical protein